MENGGIRYSDKYRDDKYEYRHVILPKEIAKQVPRGKLMSEYQWRRIGVQQSRGWEHYMIHSPEPHVLLFRRLLTDENEPPTTNQDTKPFANETNA